MFTLLTYSRGLSCAGLAAQYEVLVLGRCPALVDSPHQPSCTLHLLPTSTIQHPTSPTPSLTLSLPSRNSTEKERERERKSHRPKRVVGVVPRTTHVVGGDISGLRSLVRLDEGARPDETRSTASQPSQRPTKVQWHDSSRLHAQIVRHAGTGLQRFRASFERTSASARPRRPRSRANIIMQTPDDSASLLTPIGYDRSRCGYCGKIGSYSYYASAAALTVSFYQTLLDRGWRRSGSIIYKPDLGVSCCAQYAIRLDSEDFRPSKDQRQCINRLNRHILGDSYIKDAAKLYPLSRDQAKRRDTDFDLQERVHASERATLKTPPEPSHKLEVTLEPDNFTEEKYALFENYQRTVHHEPPQKISRSGFKSFLCKSPLPTSTSVDGRRFGSFHQCYRLDGELIAIGVLDLLPQCVSAVYFMYHESVQKHSFGKVGALREISLAKEEGYRFWYAGFYIHSCTKMKYKIDFSPQSLLDPESYTWDILDHSLKTKLDQQKYVSLSSERSKAAAAALPSTSNEESDPDPDAQMDDVDEPGGYESYDDETTILDSSIPLFARSMPGVLTRDQLLTEVDLDGIKLRIGRLSAHTADLIGWDAFDMDDSNTFKGLIAELVAAVGPEIAREMVVSFDR